jgi:hypothetical protein
MIEREKTFRRPAHIEPQLGGDVRCPCKVNADVTSLHVPLFGGKSPISLVMAAVSWVHLCITRFYNQHLCMTTCPPAEEGSQGEGNAAEVAASRRALKPVAPIPANRSVTV